MTLIISAATWDKELKAGMKQAELIPLARQAGCAGVEFRPYWTKPEEEIPEVAATLTQYGMVCSYASNEAILASSREQTLQAIQSLQAGLELAARLGAKVLRFNIANGPFDAGFISQAWWAEALRPVMAKAQTLAITLAVENGPDAKKGDPLLFKEIFAALPALKLTYDTGNWLYANTRPEAALAMFGAQVGYVHLKDIVCETGTLKHSHPGTGLVDVKGLKTRIEAGGYQGLMALEFPGGDTPLKRVASSLKYLN